MYLLLQIYVRKYNDKRQKIHVNILAGGIISTIERWLTFINILSSYTVNYKISDLSNIRDKMSFKKLYFNIYYIDNCSGH